MWRNGRRKGLKIPRGGPVPVRVRSQAPLTEVSPFWRKYMRPLLCLIFFRSFGSLPPPCCDRTVRNSDAHALCRRRDKASPVGVRYSVATLRFAPYGPVTSTTDGSLALLAKIYEAASLPHIFFALLARFSLDQTTLFTSLKLYKFPFFSSNEDLLSSLTPHLG